MPLSLDFAFEGFRIIREKPKLILFWGLVMLIGGTLVDVLLIAIAGPNFERVPALLANPHPDPAMVEAIMPNIMLALVAVAPLILIVSALLSCAVFRATWGDKRIGGNKSIASDKAGGRAKVNGDDRFGYLRVGGDEIRQLVVTTLYQIIGIGLMLVAAIVALVISSVTGAAAVIIAPVLFAIGLAGVLVIMIRLSLCCVQSFDRKTIDLFGSWKLTSKHGWCLLGGYVVATVMAMFVKTLCMVIFGAAVAAVNGSQWDIVDHLLHTDRTSLQAYFTPVILAQEVFLNLLVAPLMVALTTGAPAAAYRTLSGQVPDPGI